MQTQNQTEVLDVGIDWITATHPNASTVSGLAAFGDYLVRDAVKRGHKKHSSRALGYTGSATEGVSSGRRHDGCIVRLSGDTAKEHWEQVYSLAQNVTRLDLQVTDRTCESPAERLKAYWRRRRHRREGGGRPREWKAVVGQTGVETIMIGSRSSESYLRLYDKGKETKLPQFEGALRLEAELKAELAKHTAAWLSAQKNQQAAIAGKVSEIVCDCSGHAPRVDWDSLFLDDETAYERFPRADIRKAKGYAFLSVCVRPMLQRLIRAGELGQVLDHLGLTEYVSIKQTITNSDGPTN